MKKSGLLGSISFVMIIMIASRLLALVSSSVYMSYFGADNVELNIYSYAITIPNTIFTCLGTALSTVVIPIYASHIAQNNRLGAKKFADNIITLSVLLTAVLVVAGIALSPVIPYLTDYTSETEYPFAVKSLMIMMPVMFFYGLNFIFQGMLQSEGKFGWPAFVSVPSSLVVILYVFTLADRFGVTGLLVATFIGLAMQALILVPPLYKTGYRYKPSLKFKDPDIVTAAKMTPPVLIGVSAYQINMFYNTSMIARYDMVSLLTYVQNIVVYMVLAFVNSVTAVLYPKLTQSVSLGDYDGYKKTLSDVLANVWTLLIPVTFGLIAVRRELVSLILEWGKTGADSADAAASLMFMYALGVIGIGSKEILDRAFYALKNTLIPAVNGFVIMAVNIVLSLVFMKFFGAYGIPLAYSFASVTGLVILLIALKKKIGSYGTGLGKTVVKCIVSGAVMLVFVEIVKIPLGNVINGSSFLSRILLLGIPAAFGVLVYGIMIVLLKVPAAEFVKNALGKVVRKKA